MKILCVETSTKNFSLAVADGEKILASQDVFLKNVLSDSIVPSIQAILKKAKVPLNKLDGLAVGLGPGSFTSLRVGLSAVKALAFALAKPVVGISSLDILAMNVKERNQPICSLTDARRGMVYACIYEWQKEELKRKSDYLLVEIKELLKKVSPGTIFIGDGIVLYRKEIEKSCRKAIFYGESEFFPQARNMLALVSKRFKNHKTDDINKLVPIYLYPADCQVIR